MNAVEPDTSLRHDAIMRAIQEAANKITGRVVPITGEMRIDGYFDATSGDDFDLHDFANLLEYDLGISLHQKDWDFLSGQALTKSLEEWEEKYAPLFTFGRLADLIAARLPAGEVPAITILGAASKAAGAFRRIQRIAATVNPAVESFGPSTRIVERFRGRTLRRFWIEVRKLSINRIPPFNDARYKIAETMNGSKGVLGVLSAGLCLSLMIVALLGVRARMGWLTYGLAVAFFTLPSSFFIGFIALAIVNVLRFETPASLPNDIETFRDLAELISGDRGGWCEKCGYDLTGLTSERCPECGAMVHSAAKLTGIRGD